MRASVLTGSSWPLRLSRAEVEGLAAEVYPWRRHVHDRAGYWLTGERAAVVLGVNRARLGQLADRDLVPYVRHVDGTRLYRRAQLEAVAHGRAARWHGVEPARLC